MYTKRVKTAKHTLVLSAWGKALTHVYTRILLEAHASRLAFSTVLVMGGINAP